MVAEVGEDEGCGVMDTIESALTPPKFLQDIMALADEAQGAGPLTVIIDQMVMGPPLGVAKVMDTSWEGAEDREACTKLPMGNANEKFIYLFLRAPPPPSCFCICLLFPNKRAHMTSLPM